jgi:hypothetical protein
MTRPKSSLPIAEDSSPVPIEAGRSGLACVWYCIVAVNTHSVTVLDIDIDDGSIIERNIPFNRVSRLMSAGQLELLLRARRARIAADGIGVVVRKAARRRHPP